MESGVQAISNQQAMIQAWLDYATADLEAAERLLGGPNQNSWTLLLITFHCQQAIEKMLKRIITARGKEVLKIHDLGKLYSLADAKLSDEQVALLEELNQYYVPSRYPDLLYKPFPKLTPEEASRIHILTKEIFLCLKNQA